jgi:hypothetical protein
MGTNALPPLPLPGLARLRAALRRFPRDYRDDAIQESWVAYQLGGSPVGAVVTHWKRLKRHRTRERPVEPARIAALAEAAI